MIDKLVKNTTRELSIDYIQKVVSDYFSIPVDLMHSKTRKREIVQARQIAMYFSKSMTKSSLASIGSVLGASMVGIDKSNQNNYSLKRKGYL